MTCGLAADSVAFTIHTNLAEAMPRPSPFWRGILQVPSYALPLCNLHSCICHMERNICDNLTLRFRDEESYGAYSDLDLETNGSGPDYTPLPSE